MENIEINLAKKQPFRILGRPMNIDTAPSAVMVTKYDPDGKYLAVGYQDGTLKLFNAANGKLVKLVHSVEHPDGYEDSITCIRFKPMRIGGQMKSSNSFLALTASGFMRNYSVTMD